MAPDSSEANVHDSLARARAVNRSCERFEASWRAGERRRIADFLDETDMGDRDAMFPELLALEIELRREGGEGPGIDEYVEEFPDRGEVVARIFAELEPPPPSPGRTLENGHARRHGNNPGTTTVPHLEKAGAADFGHLSTIGDYELIDEIARGGMGVVYRARHKGLKRMVALKMILSGPMATFEERERFLREAELAANLDHPSIVPIYEIGEHESRPYFSMKLVEGTSLSKQAARFRDDPRAAARLVSTLARALHYAHGRGFLHCDLKPSNVLIDGQGKPYVTDFGLARRTGEDSSLSLSGAILGTPSYMAPEQATGSRARLGPATDVYGLGAILYELLTGRPPFRSPTIMETVVQVLERDPAPPRELRPEIPRELEGICLKCLEKATKDRYPSAGALADELDNYLHGDGIAATGVLSRLRRWNRREPELVSRLGGLSLMAVITQINLYLSTQPDRRLHWTIQSVLGLWAILSLLFQFLLRTGYRSDRVRVLWSAADIVCLTIELKLLERVETALHAGGPLVRVETTLLVGYPLLIAASGLWWRQNLVWITTLMTMFAFCWIYVDAALAWHDGRFRWHPSPDLVHPNIFLAGLVLTGYVVLRQVKRILALSRYYEHRPEA
ncbi:MAG: serine/threonine-protein kinase [Isosphaeraceae bacterium]